MSEQLVFTSCRRSIDSDTEGMQILTYSAGLSPEGKAVMPRYASYSLNGTNLNPIVKDPSLLSDYPVAFRYVSTPAGRYISNSRYVGVDWSQTRFGGNYVASAIEVSEMEGYPIEYSGSGIFHDVLQPGENSAESKPGFMPGIDLRLDPGRAVSFDSVNRFVAANGLDNVLALVGALVSSGQDIALTDLPENIPFWIGAATMAFPVSVAAGISFSTFGQIMSFEGHPIVGRPAQTPGFHAVPSGPALAGMLNEYVRRVYTEPGFRDDFFTYVGSVRSVPRDFASLEDTYLMYLLSRNDPRYIDYDREGRIMRLLSADPEGYGSDALFNFLDERMKSPDDRDVLELYYRSSSVITKPGQVMKLKHRYLDLMYETIRGFSTVEDMHSNTKPYMDIMRDYIEASKMPRMDTPVEAFLVLKLWMEEGDGPYNRLLSRIYLPGREAMLVDLIRGDSMDVEKCLSEECQLPAGIKSMIEDSSVSNLEKMSAAEINRVYGSTLDKNDDLAWSIFQHAIYRPDCEYIVDRYLKNLTYEGKHNLSDAVDKYLKSPNCSFGTLIRLLSGRSYGIGNAEVDKTIRTLNNRVYPPETDQKTIIDCQTLEATYVDYHLAIQGNNNIAAALAIRAFKNEDVSLPNGWNYEPRPDEAVAYIGKITGGALSSRHGPGWYAMVLNLFPACRNEVVACMNKYMDYELAHGKSLSAVCSYAAAAIKTAPNDDSFREFVRTVMKNRHIKREDFLAGLRRIRFLSDSEIEAVEKIYEPQKPLFGRRPAQKPVNEQPARPEVPPADSGRLTPTRPPARTDIPPADPNRLNTRRPESGGGIDPTGNTFGPGGVRVDVQPRPRPQNGSQEPMVPGTVAPDHHEPEHLAPSSKPRRRWPFGKK